MIISRTPFRISFFGGGTDYPQWYEAHGGGAVLSTSIDKYCYITCRYLPPFFKHKSRIVWSRIESVKSVDEIIHPAVRETLRFLNIDKGIEIHHDADLPARSGLGSSSSFAVGLLHALYSLQGRVVTKRQLALDAIHIEQQRLKENVGSQDQAAAAFGGFNKIEFGGPHVLSITPITISSDKINFLQKHLMLFFTGFSRNASDVAALQIKNTPEKLSELERMKKMVDESIAILNGSTASFSDFGSLLHEAWQLKRSLTSAISTSSIDAMYEDARAAGALGGKLLGAGGGGFMVFYVPPEAQRAVREKLKRYLHVPFHFENIGSQIVYYGPTYTS